MGIDSDFVTADVSDARAVSASLHPTKTWRGVEAKWIDPLRLSTLRFILVRKALDDDAVLKYMDHFKALYSAGPDGPTVYLLPADFVADLAAVADDDVGRIAAAWLRTDEIKGEMIWTPALTAGLIRELRDLARSAGLVHKPILLYFGA